VERHHGVLIVEMLSDLTRAVLAAGVVAPCAVAAAPTPNTDGVASAAE
jgi:hypothetical protein